MFHGDSDALAAGTRDPTPRPGQDVPTAELSDSLDEYGTALDRRRQNQAPDQFRSAFEHAPIGMALIGLDGRYQQANPAFCALTGRSVEQLRRLTVAEVTHPDELAADLASMDKLRAGELTNFTMDKRYLTPTGAVVWASKSSALIRCDDGTPLCYIAHVQDITGRKNFELALARERGRLHEAELIGRMGSWEVDIESGEIRWSDAMFELRGMDPKEFTGDWEAASRAVHPDDRDRVSAAIAQCRNTGEAMLVRYRATRADDGELCWFDARAKAVLEAGRLVRLAGTVIDVTDDVRAAEKASADNAFHQAIISASPDIIFVYDVVSRETVWTNRSISDMLGYHIGDGFDLSNAAAGDGDLVANVFGRLVPAVDRIRFNATLDAARDAPGDDVTLLNHRLTHADGSTRWFSRSTTALNRDLEGRVVQVVGVLRDITDAMAIENQLKHFALHDALTDLPNRALLLDRLDRALERAEREQREVSVLFCDLNGFKRVNDTAGHAAGDAVLQETARRLQAALREGDTVARVGGDEFVVVIEPWNRTGGDWVKYQQASDLAGDVPDRVMATRIAERIATSLRQPIAVHGGEHVVSASIGIAYGSLSGADGIRAVTADEVLQNADAAMYRAKSQGRDGIKVFEQGMRADIAERGRVEHVLRRSLGNTSGHPSGSGDEGSLAPAEPLLSAAYQPIFDSRTGALTGFEALARLTDAHGSIPPDVFIAVAENTGLIRELGIVMLNLACSQLATWRAQTPDLENVTMAVNVSALQAQHASLGADVRHALTAHRLKPCDLVLELTETALLQASHATTETLQALHTEGLGIAIDDFGTGYASLRYLATLPVSALKVDRSFTAGLPRDETCRKIVFAVAGLAADMELACIIEGVETEAQRAALPDGVELQGYLTGRPEPAAALDVANLLRCGAAWSELETDCSALRDIA